MTLPPLRVRWLVAPAVAVGLAVVVVAAPAPAPVPPDAAKAVAAEEAARVATIRKVAPAVVAMCMYGGQAVGSGVIIDPEGYALSNFHVVEPTGPILQCGLADGQLYDAVLVGLDKVGDVSLVKLLPKKDGTPFPSVPLGDSDKVRAGDWSLAMGNPFSLAMDFTPTVTYGLVSGTNRYQPPEGKGLLEYTDCIQIDTSINPGNSGGPLFNMAGELIGINGRGSFEKRGRVNSGVGYAISINQIKNFLGHFKAGIDTDHATLGAAVKTADEDGELSKMVVSQVLDESDAYRRGVREDDQLVSFGGRPLTSTNQYKNVLGVYPKDWRLPLVYRRGNDRKEVLVRLMGNIATEKPGQEDKDGDKPKPGGRPGGPKPPDTGKSPAAKLYVEKKGFANYYFNQKRQTELVAAHRKHGDFTGQQGAWVIDGAYDMADRKGDLRLDITDKADDGSPLVKLKLNVDYTLAPDKNEVAAATEPLGSGGLLMALYHYRRLLTQGPKGFEGQFVHGGSEPVYPPKADGPPPARLADLRVDADVLRTRHAAVDCKWYFSKADGQLIGWETFVTPDDDPCEVYCSDYKVVDGRSLPHRLDVRRGEKRFAVLTLKSFTYKPN